MSERDPIEAAARAAYEACQEWGGNEQPWDEISLFQSDVCKEHWHVIARAAVAAYLRARGGLARSRGAPDNDEYLMVLASEVEDQP